VSKDRILPYDPIVFRHLLLITFPSLELSLFEEMPLYIRWNLKEQFYRSLFIPNASPHLLQRLNLFRIPGMKNNNIIHFSPK